MAKKMTAEEILAANGFERDESTHIAVYTRTWKKTENVLWYGEKESTLEIRIHISYGIPLVQLKKNGSCESRIRDYSTLGRAMRAIREIVRCADFE